ncbi:polysaccharide pyruvyl transferase family protein [Brachybacterium huguangmaarense]|uniref:Polysaccharide pyruvyl transferase family protein n=1 Tax=Brachybacterium huguangmaarense TaxID=1652028 RepID=A0ABY6G3P1_9MICO|nr:polysaccharide pyruvyl transferase family protein [Brachybacterium huguangmaarense]UYG17269.1 polysaccharide pyruvyl transferase family protein [Brachybacterium huguangmaarense]
MKKAVLFDPSVGSINLGDHIISRSARAQLDFLLDNTFVVTLSTHTPLSLHMRHFMDADFRLALGSNLLAGKIGLMAPHWDINAFTAPFAAPVTLVGVGWRGYHDDSTAYSRSVYRRALSATAIHSVRDNYTLYQISRMGFKNVVNTGCATMWSLTPEHCATVPTTKSRNVVTTVTDYDRDPARDLQMLRTLEGSYDRVRLWPQGYGDAEYASLLSAEGAEVELLAPTIEAFDQALVEDADFVGTRLHAGIRALQLGVRSIVVAIDNRAVEKHRDFGLPILMRHDIGGLAELVECDFDTSIHMPLDAIEYWKSQFSTNAPSLDSRRSAMIDLVRFGLQARKRLGSRKVARSER